MSLRTRTGSAGIATYSYASERPTASLLFLHGYAESALRHEATLQRFAASGIATHALDLRGHGLTPGTRGFIRRFDELVADVRAERERIRAAHPALPFFLMGYSLGGLLAIRSAQTDPAELAGVVLVAPGLGIARHVPPFVRRLGVAVGEIAPHLPVARLRLTSLRSADPLPDAARRRARDPFVSARTAGELMRASHAVFTHRRPWSIPTLILHGERDRVVSIAAPRRFAAAAAGDAVTFHAIPDGLHDLLSDDPETVPTIVAWIRERARGTRAS
jgi:alpha-beta hydrolase superfamily lysophospholipase